MAGIIVYYVVGPVHPRNLALIAREMPDWTFRVTYEPAIWWLSAERMAKVPFDKVALAEDHVPDALWSGDVRAVVFSTTQLRQAPVNLLGAALERGIRTIAIEESNQIALNSGRVNNYLLPVDHLLVASGHEREGMIAAGVPEGRVDVTGWPFYGGQVGRTAPARSRAMKAQLGLEPDRPVAALTLTALNDAGESPAVRCRQMTLAAQGLPAEYQLVIKPHPIEKLSVLMPFVHEYAPRAAVVEGTVPIEDLLDATDVLLNRGASQVCIEAVHREIPVVILDTGVRTPFHGLAQDLIVETPDDLPRALACLSSQTDPMHVYAAFREAHAPYPPDEARARTCRRIVEIAESGSHSADRSAQWIDLALFQAWQLDRRRAEDLLAPPHVSGADQVAAALRQLIHYRATRDDVAVLRQALGGGFRSQVLRCLWIQQLDHRCERPTRADLEWMRDFPPAINVPWFTRHVRRWSRVLLRANESEAAMALARRLEQDHAAVSGMNEIARDIELCQGGLSQRTRYFFRQVVHEVRDSLRPVKRHVGQRLSIGSRR